MNRYNCKSRSGPFHNLSSWNSGRGLNDLVLDVRLDPYVLNAPRELIKGDQSEDF